LWQFVRELKMFLFVRIRGDFENFYLKGADESLELRLSVKWFLKVGRHLATCNSI